jgi:hypothetical protein
VRFFGVVNQIDTKFTVRAEQVFILYFNDGFILDYFLNCFCCKDPSEIQTLEKLLSS